MRPRYLVRVRGQWGSSLGRSVKVMGASYDFKETKTGSTAQCENPCINIFHIFLVAMTMAAAETHS